MNYFLQATNDLVSSIVGWRQMSFVTDYSDKHYELYWYEIIDNGVFRTQLPICIDIINQTAIHFTVNALMIVLVKNRSW